MIILPEYLLSFLAELKEAHISYQWRHHRDDTIMIEVAVPGERWEVEFFEDGTIEIEIFRSDGRIFDATLLAELLEKHAG